MPDARARAASSGRKAGERAGIGASEMFVYYFLHLNRPFDAVERRLLELTNGMHGWAVAAYREGEEIRSKLVLGVKAPIAKTVRIHVGAPLRGTAETAVPITWEATGTPGLFPMMEGDLVVAALGPDLTQVALRGTYQPPLGALGRALDRTLLHRIAEASVKGFLDRVGEALGDDAPQTAAPAGRRRQPEGGDA